MSLRPAFALVLLLAVCCQGQNRHAEGAAQPDLVLYRQLRSVGLDAAQVYRVREAALDREDIHISLTRGTLVFTEAVNGRVTGAFFEGEGEILLVPPDQVERGSLALFTGAAILEERFTTAYLRFNDDTFERLQPWLRPAEQPQEFVSRWDAACRSLADADALPLLEAFTFVRGMGSAAPGRMLHARLAGSRLGTFDVFLNTDFAEQISIGQANNQGGLYFYDVWASFVMQSARQRRGSPPMESELGRASVRISRTSVRARVLPPSDLEAEAVLTLQPREAGPRTLLFELSRYLKVSSVTSGAQPLDFIQNEALEGGDLARRGNDIVAVILPRPLAAGRTLQLSFRYAGPVMAEAGAGLMYVGARGIWYPNRGAAMSQFELEFRYPAEWTLLATGKRVAQQTAGTEQLSRWISERPVPLAGFNLGKFLSTRVQAGNMVVESFTGRGMESGFPQEQAVMVQPDSPRRPRVIIPPPPPPTPAAQAEAVARRSARTVEFLAARIGPFPFSSLTLSQKPGKLSLGWPGLIFLSSYAYLDFEQRRRLQLSDYENLLYGEVVPAHETAHQWWGSAVFWKSYRDAWLSEAMANHSALLALEQHTPQVTRAVMEEYRRELVSKTEQGRETREAGPVTLGPRLTSSRFPQAYEVVTYGRGTWLFHMLRHLLRDPGPRRDKALGDDPDQLFFQVLRRLRERFEGRELTTADVQKAFEESLPPSLHFEGKRSLDWFFQGWVNGTAVPGYALEGVKFSQRGGKKIVTGTLLQKDAPDALVTSVPLYAVTDRGLQFVGRVFADGAETPFRLPAPAGARKLVVDPHKTVLSRP